MSESIEINDSNSDSNPVLKIFLEGLYDKDCHLSKLRGCPYLVMRIWKEVRNFWREKIILPRIRDKEFLKSGVEYQNEVLNLFEESFKSETYFAPVKDTCKMDYSHCSRITRYPSFISQDFFHFSSFIHNGDNLNM